MPNANRTVYPDLVIQWNGVNITDDMMNLEWSSKVDLVEKSAGQEGNKTYIAGRSDEDITLDFADSGTVPVAAGAAGGTVARLMYRGNTGTLTWAPFGTVANQPKYSIVVLVESVTRPFKHYNLGELKTKLKANGTWIDNFDISGDVWP